MALADSGRRTLLNGFGMILLAFAEGFLIPAGVAPGQALVRAHITIFITAFLVIVIGLSWDRLVLKPAAEKVLFWSIVIGGWAGSIHPILVAVLGGTTVHGPGGVTPGTDKGLLALGTVATLLFIPAAVLTVKGLWARREPAVVAR